MLSGSGLVFTTNHERAAALTTDLEGQGQILMGTKAAVKPLAVTASVFCIQSRPELDAGWYPAEIGRPNFPLKVPHKQQSLQNWTKPRTKMLTGGGAFFFFFGKTTSYYLLQVCLLPPRKKSFEVYIFTLRINM